MARRTPTSVRLGADLIGVVVFLACIFPVYWMVSRSFLPRNRIKGEDPEIVPTHGTLDNYRKVLGDASFGDAMVISLTVTLLTVAVALRPPLSARTVAV